METLVKVYDLEELDGTLGVITKDNGYSVEIAIVDKIGIHVVASILKEEKRIFDFHLIGGAYSNISTYEKLICKTLDKFMKEEK